MKVSVVGLGYVGLVTAVTLAAKGHEVACYDADMQRLKEVSNGKVAIKEAGLEEALGQAMQAGTLSTVEGMQQTVANSEVVFICVGTPSREDGGIDLSAVFAACSELGSALKDIDKNRTVVIKSTVVPGTTDGKILPALERASGKRIGQGFGLCVNPEFLREGSALEDGSRPDRIVVGFVREGKNDGQDVMARLYEPFHCVKLYVDSRTAEMIKYASNSLLATKISFSNEIANLCDRLGIDVDEVMEGVGLDNRINERFLKAGLGFGGSCFPKDVAALSALAKAEGYEPRLLNSVLEINNEQPLRALEILKDVIGNLKGKRIGVLGLAFKPGTDDMRGSRALPIIQGLLDQGASVIAHDPLAMENARNILPDIELAGTPVEALKNSDACIIQTDDDAYATIGVRDFQELKFKLIIDGRRVLANRKDELRGAGLTYRAIGLPG